ncbi:MAG: hypothetical protein BWY91_02367 [bacterium ADurb.BinA028]|nr:MAG: hypothetical protein BWY91_02367 [bacterium ADurb.BinA028]
MSAGFSAGILASAAAIICTDRSSGRMSLSEPLNARPIGLRAVETMTASVTGGSSSSRVRAAAGERALSSGLIVCRAPRTCLPSPAVTFTSVMMAG